MFWFWGNYHLYPYSWCPAPQYIERKNRAQETCGMWANCRLSFSFFGRSQIVFGMKIAAKSNQGCCYLAKRPLAKRESDQQERTRKWNIKNKSKLEIHNFPFFFFFCVTFPIDNRNSTLNYGNIRSRNKSATAAYSVCGSDALEILRY